MRVCNHFEHVGLWKLGAGPIFCLFATQQMRLPMKESMINSNYFLQAVCAIVLSFNRNSK